MNSPISVLGVQTAPVVLTAGGTLLGVLITILVQALSSYLQRRFEKKASLVDARLDAYSEFLTALLQWGRARSEFEAFDASEEVAEVKKLSDRRDKLPTEMAERIAEFEEKGELSPSDRSRARELADSYKAELEALPAKIREAAEASAPIIDKMKSAEQRVRKHNDDIQRLGFRVSLLGGKKVREALNPVVKATLSGTEPPKEAREKLEREIRNELNSS